MAWWKKQRTVEQTGSVHFRGTIPPRLENFASLAHQGIRIEPRPCGDDAHWQAELTHSAWGKAELGCLRHSPPPPRLLLQYDPRLTEAEKRLAALAGSAVRLKVEARTGNVLSDRKDLLRYLGAVMADDGVVAVDHDSQAFWARAGLDDELAHDAELDIDAVYSLHLVGGSAAEDEAEPAPAYWLHSHGLRELGFWDFDVLAPSPDLGASRHDLNRAIAFAVVERRLELGGRPLGLATGVTVQAVAARDCLARLPADAHRKYRDSVDDWHLDGHGILCEPAQAGWFQRLVRGARPQPSEALQHDFGDAGLVFYSNSATDLMARRARQTLPLLRELSVELADLDLPVLVKLGYPTDTGGPSDREHLWFKVHGFRGDEVDATLTNAPLDVADLAQGQRGTSPLELLSDWTILTPVGTINPRQTRALRLLRANRAQIARELAAHRAAAPRS